MRLISCEIAGFGRIQNQSFTFSEGLNAFCRENGWGKTTFSVFLKAMFYGMEYSRKRGLSERAHYMPWQGGVYGGNLTFEARGRRYRIERSFGKTDKEDVFALYDLATGKPSSDFGENVGEALFQVDRVSFEKSIFIPQSAPETEMTDSLNAKMGDLSAAKDDMNNFDAAIGRIREARQDYTRNSKVNMGKLEGAKQQLRHCQRQLEKRDALNQGYERQQELLEQKKKNLKELQGKKQEIAREILRQSRLEQARGVYLEKRQALERGQKELEEADAFFASGMPPTEEMERIEEDYRREQVDRLRLSEMLQQQPVEERQKLWEDMFSAGVPSWEETDEWLRAANRMQELRITASQVKLPENTRRQWEELQQFFSKGQPAPEELEQIGDQLQELSKMEGQMQEIENRCARGREAIREQEAGQAGSGHVARHILAGILTACLVAAGITMHLYGGSLAFLIAEILFFAGACAFAAFYVFYSVRRRQMEKEQLAQMEETLRGNEERLRQLQDRSEALSGMCRGFLENFRLTTAGSLSEAFQEVQRNLRLYDSLKAETADSMEKTANVTDELADAQMQLYTRLEPYAEACGCDLYQSGGEQELIQKIRQEAEAYQSFCKLASDIQCLKGEVSARQAAIAEFLGHYPLESSLSAEEKIQKLQREVRRYETLEEQTDKLSAELAACQENPELEQEARSVEELQRVQGKLDEQIAGLTTNTVEDKEHLAEMARELEELDEIELQSIRLSEQVREYEDRVELLKQTEYFLQKARERFLAEYMEPLQTGLQKYLTMLQRTANRDFDISGVQLDMDLSVRILCQGSSRERNYFSRGYQDMAELCARFALLDVLYREEQPMLILDDPFTNFDEEKAGYAMELLRYLAGERQIIYYTCHESRMPSTEKTAR